MEASAVTDHVLGIRNELTRRVKTVERRECGGMAGQEGRARRPGRAVPASGASNPDKIASGVCHQEEGLRWGTERQRNEVLAGAGVGAGGDGQLSGGGAVF